MPILTLPEAIDLARKLRHEGKRIVTTNGAFDLLSIPHLHLLEAARREGDILLVGVNSDVSVRGLKGEKRPIIPEKERAGLVAGLRCVDGVFLFNEPDPRAWLREICPDVHVNSVEYTEQCIEADVLREIGARLVLVPRDAVHLSTSDVIQVICDRYCS